MRADLVRKFITSRYLVEEKTKRKRYFANFIASLVICVLTKFGLNVKALPGSSVPATAPWAKEPEYFRALEHGFCLCAALVLNKC